MIIRPYKTLRDERAWSKASEFSQRATGFGFGGWLGQEVQLAGLRVLLDLRVPLFPIQFVKPTAKLGVVRLGESQNSLLYFRYGFHFPFQVGGQPASHSSSDTHAPQQRHQVFLLSQQRIRAVASDNEQNTRNHALFFECLGELFKSFLGVESRAASGRVQTTHLPRLHNCSAPVRGN